MRTSEGPTNMSTVRKFPLLSPRRRGGATAVPGTTAAALLSGEATEGDGTSTIESSRDWMGAGRPSGAHRLAYGLVRTASVRTLVWRMTPGLASEPGSSTDSGTTW